MIHDIEAYLIQAAHAARAHWLEKAKSAGGYSLRSFLHGEWIVLSRFHPELSGIGNKALFFRTAGAQS